MIDETIQSDSWFVRLREGTPAALDEVFEHFRPRLRRMVELRIDARLSGRLDPSDVLQEAFLEAARRVERYVAEPLAPLYVWLRGLAWDMLVRLQRRHLGAACRSVRRELPAHSSVLLGRQAIASSTPSQKLIDEEIRRRVHASLESLDAIDREVLFMRHFEEMGNGEVARALGISDSAASMRYGRALYRLREVLLGGRETP